MTSHQQLQKRSKPPRLLRGMFSLIVFITSLILLSAGFILNYQVEQLIATRTSEYAHSIASIAANSAAEALLSDDNLQLKLLVETIARDPYIRDATVFAEDGQIVAQFPEVVNLSNINQSLVEQPIRDAEAFEFSQNNEVSTAESGLMRDSKKLVDANTQAYLELTQDIPFVEKITYQGVTAGWFKISLNRDKLEKSFLDSLHRSRNLIITIALLLLSCLFIIILKFNRRVKSLVKFNHRLIQLNAAKLPHGTKQWLESIQQISETRLQKLPEHPSLPAPESIWIASKKPAFTAFCYCQFSMQDQENELTASCLTLAEYYLQSAIQAHGVQSQGDILSGCLLPFFDFDNKQEALIEIVSLLHLVQELLGSLELPVKMRAFIGYGSILILENERAVITGVSLSNRLQDKIVNLTPSVGFGEIASIGFEPEQLQQLGEFTAVKNPTKIECYKLVQVSEAIEQQVNRQISFIKANKTVY